LVQEELDVSHLRRGLMVLTLFWVLLPLLVAAKEVCNKTTQVQLVVQVAVEVVAMVVAYKPILLVRQQPVKVMQVVVVDTLAVVGLAGEAVEAQEAMPAASDAELFAQRIRQLEAEQLEASQLINTLAEQNAQLVATMDRMRSRLRMLTAGCVLLAVGLVALWLR
jgi:uncharacterized coiled-coil protein SlyX